MTNLTVIEDNLNLLCAEKAGAFPKDFNQTRFIQNALYVLNDVYGIEKIKPEQIAQVLIKGAFLGLDFLAKECYAIVYDEELNFQTDYKGEKKLIEKYSVRPIKNIYAKLIRENDDFQESIIDGKPSINFFPKPLNDGEIIGAFAVCEYQDGGIEYDVMTRHDIEKTRENYAKKSRKTGKFSPAWYKSFGEMCKKTVSRRLYKVIPKCFDSIEQQKVFDEISDFDVNKKQEPQKAKSSMFSEEPIEAEAEIIKDDAREEPEEEVKVFACTKCGVEITENVSKFSVREYKKALCINCQKKEK